MQSLIIIGDSWLQLPEGKRQRLVVDMCIWPKDTIVLEANAKVKVIANDLDVFFVKGPARISIDASLGRFRGRRVIKFNLIEGQIFGTVAAKKSNSIVYKFNTTLANIEVRNGCFSLQLEQPLLTTTLCNIGDGEVEAKSTKSKEFIRLKERSKLVITEKDGISEHQVLQLEDIESLKSWIGVKTIDNLIEANRLSSSNLKPSTVFLPDTIL